jgi:hypothetical protein
MGDSERHADNGRHANAAGEDGATAAGCQPAMMSGVRRALQGSAMGHWFASDDRASQSDPAVAACSTLVARAVGVTR